jgi:hypothetical protein
MPPAKHQTGDVPPEVYRAPMRSRVLDLPDGDRRRLGGGLCLVGIGERLPAAPTDLAEAVLMSAEAYGERAARRLLRFAQVAPGSLVWTRELDGGLRIGRMDGEWSYLDSPGARAVGIHHVRACSWKRDRFTMTSAPAAVVATFNRGGLNFQRINDPGIGRLSAQISRAPGPQTAR